jgi:hypothetical protein
LKLIQLFEKLMNGSLPEHDTFKIIPIPKFPNHKIGLDKDGALCLLLKTYGISTTRPTSRKLKYLEILFNKECKIYDSKKPEKGNHSESYTIIILKLFNRDFQIYFLSLCYRLLENIGNNTSLDLLVVEIEKIIELFQFISRPSLKTIQGLFGELLVIYEAHNSEYMLKAWHIEENATFDFDDGNECLEVKTSSKGERIHSFSHQQLNRLVDKPVFIGSILTSRSDFGLSIFDLANLIKRRINNSGLIIKLDRVIFQTLNEDMNEIGSIKFDFKEASKSKRFYSTDDIPKIPDDCIPINISKLKYDISLNDIQEASLDSDLIRSNYEN